MQTRSALVIAKSRSKLLLWTFLILMTIAELITATVWPQGGMVMHIVLMVGLIGYGALTTDSDMQRVALALMLMPLIRVLSLGLPLLRLPQLSWYPVVAAPLLLTAAVLIWQFKLSRRDLSLTAGRYPAQLALSLIGIPLGAIEYAILRPEPLIAQPTLEAIWWPALILLAATAFNEELIFRGLIQHLMLKVMGRGTIAYVAILFGVLHMGYLSVVDIVFVTVVGFMFGWIVYKTGSLLGVTLAHGLTNSLMFLIMPFAMRPEYTDLWQILLVVTCVSGLISLTVFVIMVLKSVWLEKDPDRPNTAE